MVVVQHIMTSSNNNNNNKMRRDGSSDAFQDVDFVNGEVVQKKSLGNGSERQSSQGDDTYNRQRASSSEAFQYVDFVDGEVVRKRDKDKRSPVNSGVGFPDMLCEEENKPSSSASAQVNNNNNNNNNSTSHQSEPLEQPTPALPQPLAPPPVAPPPVAPLTPQYDELVGATATTTTASSGDNSQQQQQQQQQPQQQQQQEQQQYQTVNANVTNSSSSNAAPLLLRERVQTGISKRNDFPLQRSKVCLLIVDMQKYCSENPTRVVAENASDSHAYSSYLYNESLPTAIPNIESLVEQFRTHRDAVNDPAATTTTTGCEVIFTYLQSLTNDRRDISLDYKLSGPKLATIPSINENTIEELFLDTLQPSTTIGKGDILIPKTSCSVFVSTNLDYVLRNLGMEQIVICGQVTNQCVESACRDAADLGYFVTIPSDACAAYSYQDHQKGCQNMKGFARIVTTHQILSELSSDDSTTTKSSSAQQQPQQYLKLPQLTPPPQTSSSQANSSTLASLPCPQDSALESAYTLALLRTLRHANIQFVRYCMVDVCNTIRCKVIPLEKLLEQNYNSSSSSLKYQVPFASVVCAGLPSFADYMFANETGLDARNCLLLQPDIQTLQILPYAPKSASVFGTLHNYHDSTTLNTNSEFCSRGLLQKVVQFAKTKFGYDLCVGAEIEFCLHDLGTDKPIDSSIFANTITLNQQEEFLSDVYNQLNLQEIPIDMLHSESAPGQLEIVIKYQTDPVKLVDMVILAQETIRNAARKHSCKALFLPKIHQMAAGNGLHVHLSFQDCMTGENRFCCNSNNSSNMSPEGQSFLEGILQHLPSLLGLTLPTVNSFRRVGQGCWTGHSVDWAIEDKEAPLRVCKNLYSSKLEHVEYKLCDSTANLYLALASIFFVGLQGIHNHLLLRPSKQNNINGDEEKSLPKTLDKSLNELEKDGLLYNDLLGCNLGRAYIALRRAEMERSSKMSLEEEVIEALERA